MRTALSNHFGRDLYLDRGARRTEAAKLDDGGANLSHGGILVELIEQEIAPGLVQPTLVIDYPKDVSVRCHDIMMARQSRNDPLALKRFELYVGGIEIANCFSEINDADEQKDAFDRFLADSDGRRTRIDPVFLHTLRVGMPPAAGVGIGLDRLLMVPLGRECVNDTATFLPTFEATLAWHAPHQRRRPATGPAQRNLRAMA